MALLIRLTRYESYQMTHTTRGVTAGKFTAQKLTSILKTFSYLAYAIDWQVHKNKNINLILFNFESFFGFKLKFSILID